MNKEEEEEEKEEEMITHMTPSVQVIRFIFIINATFCLVVSIWGIIPYYVMRFDVPTYVIGILFGISAFFFLISYGALFIFVDVAAALVLCQFFLFMLLNVFAVVLGSLAPFQAIGILFMQNVAVLIYCLLSTRHLDVLWAGGFMFGASVCGWLLGIYVFMIERDWLVSGLLFLFFVIGGAAYSTFQISRINTEIYNLNELVKAAICFYTDPITLPVKWIKLKYTTTYQEL